MGSYSPCQARRMGLCWAVALMALATRRQQAHTGSPPRGWGRTPGPPELPSRSKPTDLSCRQQSLAWALLFQKEILFTEISGSPRAQALQFGKYLENLVSSSTKCLVVQFGRVSSGACTQAEVKEKLRRRREGKGEERGQERSEVGTRWPQARGAPGPGHISVRMSMRLFSPER